MNSAIPAAMTALLADLTALFPVGGDVEVSDGPVTNYVKLHRVEVFGVRNWVQDPAGLGNMRRDETFDIECRLTYTEGDQDRPGARTAAFVLIDEIEDAITADPNLLGRQWFTGPGVGSPGTGAVRFAELHKGDVRQGVTNKGGWAVEIDFDVHCEATIERTP